MIALKKSFPLLRSGALALALLAIPAGVAHADVKAGVDAWSAGDYAGAIREWQVLADRGDPDAQFNLAQAYKMGRGVPMDLAKARDLYGKAAAKGHTQAADAYGLLLFQDGERAKAMPYIEASAARGDPRAQYILGVAHFNGDNVAKDWVRAYALVSIAQQAGLPQATSAIAQMDAHIPLADRQKAVLLATSMAADAEATRQQQTASAELGTRIATSEPAAGPSRGASSRPAPEIVSARNAASEAARMAGSDSPASAGADYTLRTPPPVRKAPEPALAAKPASASVPKPITPKPSENVAKPAPSASGPWRIQLGAFGVAGNAEALWAKVRGRAELAGHAKALVPAGKLTKLQATGFATRAAAEAACTRLSAGGFGCIAVSN